MSDAVIIGAGQNGLVAANLLADRGWEVTVLEEASEPGGAVRSGELIEPGYVNDLFSAFYPFAAASPHIGQLELERWGLRWLTGPVPVADPGLDGRCALISLDLDETMASLDAFAPGDGAGWRSLYGLWERVRKQALAAFFGPLPPVRPLMELVIRLGPAEITRLARFSLLPVNRMAREHFSGDGGARLLAGNALHADATPEEPLSGAFGWVLCCLAQQHGFPVVEGGAGKLTRALVRRLESRGGRVLCGARAVQVECRAGTATAVLTDDERIVARRAVIADVGPPQLYQELLSGYRLAPRVLSDLARFEYDSATVKVDWTLDAPIPWTAASVRRAATVHVTDSLAALTRYAADLACNQIPAVPYLVMGQYASIDPSRAPAGGETAWAYTHIPQRIEGDVAGKLTGRWNDEEAEAFADRIEERIETFAPGFRGLIRGRHIFTPKTFECANRNLVGGAVNGGTARLYHQVVFRPLTSFGRPETPVARLYLGSASVHPGGGVHGGPGANAAAAALAGAGWSRPSLVGQAARRLQR